MKKNSEEISTHAPTKASEFGYEEVNEPASQEGGSISFSYPDTLITQFISVGKMADSLAELNRLLQKERSRNSILMEENYSLKLKLGAIAVNNAAEKEPGSNNTCTRIADDSSKNNNFNNSNDSNNRNKSTLSSKENNQKKTNEKESKKVGAMGQTKQSPNNEPIESNSESRTINNNNKASNSEKPITKIRSQQTRR